MQNILKSNVKLKITIGFTLTFLAFIGVQIFSTKNIEDLKNSQHQLLSSNLLSERIGNIITSVTAYRSKVNNFVLTGNKKFISGNAEDLRKATINLQYLHDLPVNSEQNALLVQLDTLVKKEIDFVQQVLIAFNKENRNDAIALVNTGEGKQLIENIVNTCNGIQEIEEDNLTEIVKENAFISNKVVYMNYVASAFALAAILFSLFIAFNYINTRTRIEKQLRDEQQKAEQSAILKEQFMANMSHEIRTPMNAIIGFTNLLSKTDLDEKQAKHVKAIQASGETLLNIINDILDFSKIEAGMLTIEKTPFSPSELLGSLNVMFYAKANEKHLQLSFITSVNLPEMVIGDPKRLTQILVNLINNAIKFTNEGIITVKTEVEKEENDTATIRFTVKDTGIGIPKDKFKQIFERFSQVTTDTSRKYGGSGLGLSIVKQLVELQGGAISVESAEGVGSSFIFTITYKKSIWQPTTHKTNGHQIQPALKNNIKILVAEDNLLNQQLAASLLSEWGFDYDIVENGKMAIEKFKTNHYDLVLMDIQMPEMNGYDTAQYIRNNLKLDLPILAMTAHVLTGEKEKCISYGMTDYISKPIRENELHNLISKYTDAKVLKVKNDNKSQNPKDYNGKVTNLSYLNELSNGKPAFVSKMIDLFLKEVPVEIQQLENAIQQVNFEAIKTFAHKIKSSIPFAGLDDKIKGELSAMEEYALRNSNLPQIKILFDNVKETCLKAVDELSGLKQHS